MPAALSIHPITASSTETCPLPAAFWKEFPCTCGYLTYVSDTWKKEKQRRAGSSEVDGRAPSSGFHFKSLSYPRGLPCEAQAPASLHGRTDCFSRPVPFIHALTEAFSSFKHSRCHKIHRTHSEVTDTPTGTQTSRGRRRPTPLPRRPLAKLSRPVRHRPAADTAHTARGRAAAHPCCGTPSSAAGGGAAPGAMPAIRLRPQRAPSGARTGAGRTCSQREASGPAAPGERGGPALRVPPAGRAASRQPHLVDGQAHGVAEGLQQRGARGASGHGVSPAPGERAAEPEESLLAGRPRRWRRRQQRRREKPQPRTAP